MKLATKLSAYLSIILIVMFFFLSQTPANAQKSVWGHGVQNYEQYKDKLASQAYWNSRDRENRSSSSYSTSSSSSNQVDYRQLERDRAKERERERISEENRRRREIEERTIHPAGASSILLDSRPVDISGMRDFAFVKHKGRWGVYNKITKALVASPEYTNILAYQSSHLKLEKNGQVGIADLKGNVKIPLGRYREITPTNHLFIVRSRTGTGKYGVVDFDGKLIHEPDYRSYAVYNDFVVLEKSNTDFTLLNKQGKVVSNGEQVIVASPTFAFKKVQSEYTFINPNTGQPLINQTFSAVGTFWEHNIIAAQHNGKFTLFNNAGRKISATEFDNLSISPEDSTVWVTVKGNKIGIIDILIDENGFESLPAIYDSIISYDRETAQAEVLLNGRKEKVAIKTYGGYTSISPSNVGYLKATKGNNVYLITKDGRAVSPAYDHIKGIYQHSNTVYAIVEKNGKKGYQFPNRDTRGLTVFPYEDAGEIDNRSSLSKVKMNGYWGAAYHDVDYYANNSNAATNRSRNIVACNFDDVNITGDKTILVKKGKKWGGFFYSGLSALPKALIPLEYDAITTVWYRSKTQSQLSPNNCNVVYYAKKGRSTDHYTEDDGKVKKDPYSSMAGYEKNTSGTDALCKITW